MSAARVDRQDAIRKIVRDEPIRTQTELVNALADLGFAVTQATVSRDIADLGLGKNAHGVYALAEDTRLNMIVGASVKETRRAGNQVLVFTDPGTAGGVAAAFDSANFDGVLGSIAGDDTILVITSDNAAGSKFEESIRGMLLHTRL